MVWHYGACLYASQSTPLPPPIWLSHSKSTTKRCGRRPSQLFDQSNMLLFLWRRRSIEPNTAYIWYSPYILFLPLAHACMSTRPLPSAHSDSIASSDPVRSLTRPEPVHVTPQLAHRPFACDMLSSLVRSLACCCCIFFWFVCPITDRDGVAHRISTLRVLLRHRH